VNVPRVVRVELMMQSLAHILIYPVIRFVLVAHLLLAVVQRSVNRLRLRLKPMQRLLLVLFRMGRQLVLAVETLLTGRNNGYRIRRHTKASSWSY
jgi:fructose-specific phosphotransferase system IIC component